MATDETADFVERFNREGGPVPEVDPDLLRTMWKRLREAARMRETRKTIGLGAVGLDASCLGDAPREKLAVVSIRLGLLQSLFERNVLREYLQSDEVADEVFQAAARLPCDKEDIAEAMVQLRMKQVPEADYSELKGQMITHGYNPDEPRIDSRFLAWIQNH